MHGALEPPAIGELCEAYEKYGKSVVGIKEVSDELIVKYSSLKLEQLDEKNYAVSDMIEKPSLDKKFSNYSILGRCVLDNEIFSILENTPFGVGGELQLTDAMRELAVKYGMIGVDFSGVRYDMGNKLGILKANIEVGLSHPEIKDASIPEQYRLIHEAGGMVIQAHPYREEPYIPEVRLFPDDVDGVEGINATHSSHLSKSHKDPEFDVKAIAYARAHRLPMTAGSDVHNTILFGGGVAFKRKLTSIQDYCHAILSGEDYLLTNGDAWFHKTGEPL